MFDAVVFAGGGNRCYWQGGFYETVAPRLGLAPKLVVGASAGAFAATYSMLGAGPDVRRRVFDGCGPTFEKLRYRGVAPRRTALSGRSALQQASGGDYRRRCTQAAQRPHRSADRRDTAPRGLPPLAGAIIGIGAYQLEKHLLHPVHPRFGRALGFRPEYISARTLTHAGEICDALMASSGVPPFMPVTSVKGIPAFDGGLVDNVPVEPLKEIESADGRTLVLLTRVYKNLPSVQGRIYTQPSRRIELSQFDITNPDAIKAAYELGIKDGDAFAASFGK